MAQLVERILGKDEVAGSTPASSSKNPERESGRDFFAFKQKKILCCFANLLLFKTYVPGAVVIFDESSKIYSDRFQCSANGQTI